MKEMLRAVAMAFSMFSVLPVPRVDWKRENMRYMLCCLPLIGVVIGLALWGWLALCDALRFGAPLFAAGLTLWPTLLSGGIHIDGFCDTVDALSSRAAPARKREILKDPHAGAFAITFAVVWFLLYFALCTEMTRARGAVLLLGVQQVFARTLGALACVRFPAAGSAGLAADFRDAASVRSNSILLVWAVLCASAMLLLSPAGAIASLLLGGACYLYLRRMCARAFGGMSGDLAGFLITLSQLVMLMGSIFAERIVRLWF